MKPPETSANSILMSPRELLDRYAAGKRGFIGVNLQCADLRGAKLIYTNLDGANLKGVILFAVNLNQANLVGTDLSETTLIKTDTRYTILSESEENQDIKY